MDSNSGILSENTNANYTERYDSLLKMKNHVSMYLSRTKPVEVSSSVFLHISFAFVGTN